MPTKIRTDFYVMTPCSLVGRYCRVGGSNCFHLQGSFTSSLKLEAYFSFEMLLPVYNIQFTLYNIQYTIYSRQYKVYSIKYTIYSIKYTVQYTVYNVQYTVYNIQYRI